MKSPPLGWALREKGLKAEVAKEDKRGGKNEIADRVGSKRFRELKVVKIKQDTGVDEHSEGV